MGWYVEHLLLRDSSSRSVSISSIRSAGVVCGDFAERFGGDDAEWTALQRMQKSSCRSGEAHGRSRRRSGQGDLLVGEQHVETCWVFLVLARVRPMESFVST